MALGNPPIALPLGRAVGGTTVINSGTCFRPPTAVATAWHEQHGLALADLELLGPRVADVEATIGVAPAPMEVLGRNGELALEGAAALDWQSAPLRRNAPGCRGACQCAIGCPNNAKGGVHLNALPQACEAGARIVSGLHVKRVLSEAGRATGVTARRADGSEVRISAPLVVVAAGAIPTPPLLRRSGLGRHPRLGRNLSIHPATGITAELRGGGGALARRDAERRDRGAARARGRPARGHLDARRGWARSRRPATAPTCWAASTAPPTRRRSAR